MSEVTPITTDEILESIRTSENYRDMAKTLAGVLVDDYDRASRIVSENKLQCFDDETKKADLYRHQLELATGVVLKTKVLKIEEMNTEGIAHALSMALEMSVIGEDSPSLADEFSTRKSFETLIAQRKGLGKKHGLVYASNQEFLEGIGSSPDKSNRAWSKILNKDLHYLVDDFYFLADLLTELSQESGSLIDLEHPKFPDQLIANFINHNIAYYSSYGQIGARDKFNQQVRSGEIYEVLGLKKSTGIQSTEKASHVEEIDDELKTDDADIKGTEPAHEVPLGVTVDNLLKKLGIEAPPEVQKQNSQIATKKRPKETLSSRQQALKAGENSRPKPTKTRPASKKTPTKPKERKVETQARIVDDEDGTDEIVGTRTVNYRTKHGPPLPSPYAEQLAVVGNDDQIKVYVDFINSKKPTEWVGFVEQGDEFVRSDMHSETIRYIFDGGTLYFPEEKNDQIKLIRAFREFESGVHLDTERKLNADQRLRLTVVQSIAYVIKNAPNHGILL